ncbi:MAG: hypothetical protein Q9M25_05305 [Mariprofundaceae bacterium]|nr:hypothetical protein [Mariprofundaceae bacterium]
MKQPVEHKDVKNSVTVGLVFDFRGQRFTPSIDIDLDALMHKPDRLSVNGLYNMLAASIGLDAYRHEYDVMAMHELVFSQPTGLACEFVADGKLDFDGFIHAWQQQRIRKIVQAIAGRHLNISDLTQHDNIEKALIESYLAGRKHAAQDKNKAANSDLRA